jgi:hypothetical protein
MITKDLGLMIPTPATTDTSRIIGYCEADWAGDRTEYVYFGWGFTDLLGKYQTIIHHAILCQI